MRHHTRTTTLALVFISLQALLIRLAFGPNIREDAYITLRYVKNLVAGQGFVYNFGEHVLGTTTPLYTLLLAAVGWLGVEPTVSAVVVGVATDLLTILVIFVFVRRVGGPAIALMACLVYSLLSPVVAHAVSGMETPLYNLLIIGTFLSHSLGRSGVTGVLSGLAVWLRPDGLLVAAVLLTHHLWRRRRGLVAWILAFSAVLFPWLIFASLYFGSPIPQSVVAKMDLGMERFIGLKSFAAYFTDLEARWFLPLSPLFLWGVWTTWRRHPSTRPLFLWAFLYAVAFIATDKFVYPIWPFEWYFLPLLVPFSIGAAAGLHHLLAISSRAVGRPWLGLSLQGLLMGLIVALYAMVLVGQHANLRKIVGGREDLYRLIAQHLTGYYGVTDEVVVAPEIGTLGYFYPGPILDVNGLVSPEAMGVNFTTLVEAKRPHWLASYDTLIPDELLKADWFQREYKEVYSQENWETRKAMLYRRYPPLPPGRGGRELALGEVMALDGYSVAAESTDEAGTQWRIVLQWQGLSPMERRYTTFVHVIDGRGSKLAQKDSEPQEAIRATDTWRPGETIVDVKKVVVPYRGPMEDLFLVVGAYQTWSPGNLLSWRNRAGRNLGPYLHLPASPMYSARELGAIEGLVSCHSLPTFGTQIQLLAFTTSIQERTLKLTLYWRGMRPLDQDYTVFVHLVGPDGRIVSQHDDQPRDGIYPTSMWGEKEIVADGHRLALPPGISLSAYRLAVGLYHLESGRHLPLAEGDGDDLLIPLAPSPSCPGQLLVLGTIDSS